MVNSRLAPGSSTTTDQPNFDCPACCADDAHCHDPPGGDAHTVEHEVHNGRGLRVGRKSVLFGVLLLPVARPFFVPGCVYALGLLYAEVLYGVLIIFIMGPSTSPTA